MKFKRSSGILLHISSLPGKYGIGTFGTEAYEFVDFLISSRQRIWQLLPLGHTGYGDSPYQCYSAFAGNPLLIDLEILVKQKYLTEAELETTLTFSESEVEYDKVHAHKTPLLEKAAERFKTHASRVERVKYESFCEQNEYWLNDYTIFIALKQKHDGKPWWEWDEKYRFWEKEKKDEIESGLNDSIFRNKVIQFFFYSQWVDLKSYANRNGIQIIGDIPLYIAHDSADAWRHHKNFWFDEQRNPVRVAGVPPDYFSETGQLWGNPLYNWEYLEENRFEWWIERIKASFKLFDILRIDHFRGLAAYWAVPFGEKTAVKGDWLVAPGKSLLDTIYYELGELPIIAEDLGVITPDVEELRDGFNFPGMKILQFAFDTAEENEFRPHTYPQNCVVYTGTHDNNTTKGWYRESSEADKQMVSDYFNPDENNISWSFIKLAMASVADMAIFPIQDLLDLDESARMNIPSVPSGQWKFRFKSGSLNDELIDKLVRFTKLYGRI